LHNMDSNARSIFFPPLFKLSFDLAVNYKKKSFFIQFTISQKHSFNPFLFSDYLKDPPSSSFAPQFYLVSPNFRKILLCIFRLNLILLNLRI
jgi:hypothetical protein